MKHKAPNRRELFSGLLVTDIGFPNGDGGNPVELLLLTQPPKNSTLLIKYKGRQHTERGSHYIIL